MPRGEEGGGGIRQCLGTFLFAVFGGGDVSAISWVEARDIAQHLHGQYHPTTQIHLAPKVKSVDVGDPCPGPMGTNEL